MTQTPSLGRIVHYTLTALDAERVNKRRADAQNLNAAGVTLASQCLGPQIHVGNPAAEGDRFPMDIVRVWSQQPDDVTPSTAVNGQVKLDGNDTLWVTSVTAGDGPGHFAWPSRV